MLFECVFSNVWVVSVEWVFVGSVLLCDGLIVVVDEGCSYLVGVEDLGGDYLLFGLVELYIDNLEKYMILCFGVDWLLVLVVLVYDVQIVVVGIIMVFDVLFIGDVNFKGKCMQQLLKMFEVIGEVVVSGDVCVDYCLYLCCEVSYLQMLEVFCELVEYLLV